MGNEEKKSSSFQLTFDTVATNTGKSGIHLKYMVYGALYVKRRVKVWLVCYIL